MSQTTRRPPRRAIFALVASLLFAVCLYSNYSISQQRDVYAVNGFATPQAIVVDGGTRTTIPPFSALRLTVKEGSHQVTFESLDRALVQFEVRAESYLDRWFEDFIWVINPRGAAVVVEDEATYSRNPPPPKRTFHFGEEVQKFAGVTHPFRKLPPRLDLKGKEDRVLTQLQVLEQPSEGFLQFLISQKETDRALQFAELRLPFERTNATLIRGYSQLANTSSNLVRAANFLKRGLTNRPPSIEWHRAYQNVAEDATPEANLVAIYNAFLKNDPTNSTLLYLRGRIAISGNESLSFHTQALENDPSNAYANYAVGFNYWTLGDWKSAKPYLERAAQLKADPTFVRMRDVARLATDDFKTLEEDLRQRLKAQPADFLAAQSLEELLVASKRAAECEEVSREFQRAIQGAEKENVASLRYLKLFPLYATASFAELQGAAKDDPIPVARRALYESLIEQGALAEAEQVVTQLQRGNLDPMTMFAFAIASQLRGSTFEAKSWIDRGIQALRNGPREFRQASRLLESAQPPAEWDFARISLEPKQKAILAAICAIRYPSASGRFSELAGKLNVEHSFPHHLLRKLTARADQR